MSGAGNGPVTLQDVARAAGVSLATASRVLNGSGRSRPVRDDLRERVLKNASRLEYVPNAPAQAMARGRSSVVGLVVQDIADPYFSSIAAGVMRSAEENHLLVTLGSTLRRPERELDYVSALHSQRSRAVILAGSRVGDAGLLDSLRRQLDIFRHSGGQVVLISQQRLPMDTVVLENRAGAKALARELVALGYRRFAVLTGPRRLLTVRDRLAGFRDGLVGSPQPEPVLFEGEFTRDGGYGAMTRLLAAGPGVDCVFAVNDVMAVGAMAAARDHGLHLPRDLALAGFDDIVTLRDITPPLTTVRLPLEEIGSLAVDLLLSAAGSVGAGWPARRRRVRGEVIVRASTPRRSPRG